MSIVRWQGPDLDSRGPLSRVCEYWARNHSRLKSRGPAEMNLPCLGSRTMAESSKHLSVRQISGSAPPWPQAFTRSRAQLSASTSAEMSAGLVR
jgi:hypothetical protein